MDISRLRQSQMIAGGAGIILVVSLFLDWGLGLTAFDLFSVMDIIMLLIGVAAIAYAALPAAGSAQTLPSESGWILLLLGVAVVGFVLGFDLENSFAGFGAWLALIASLALAYAAYSEVRGGPLAARMGMPRGAAPARRAGAPPAEAPPAGAPREQPAAAPARAMPQPAGTRARPESPRPSGGRGASGGGTTPPSGTP